MYFYSNVIAIVICVNIRFVRIHSERDSEIETEKNGEPERMQSSEDTYTFLALIDVVFTDGSKRTCTGTIIHDNVVITAAHCLSTDELKAELTASFVVIGTKRMFDAGYEQYLPIERVIIHPNYRGWTADLALVYTFAGMMSDKPGKVIRLANERTSVPDSDVTVFSWGHCQDDEESMTTPDFETSCSEEDEFKEREAVRERKLKVTSFIRIHSGEHNVRLHSKSKTHKNKSRHSKSGHSKKNKKRKHLRKRKSKKTNKYLPTTLQKRFKKKKPTKSNKETTFDPDNLNFHQRPKTYNSNQSNVSSGEDVFERKEGHFQDTRKKPKSYHKKKKNRHVFKRMSHYKNNWRRKMGNQKNTLTAEIFSFVNTQTCTKLTGKSMSSTYEIENPNEILCYANEEFYITEEDSGAPALRQGRLVAVTVAGIDYEGEHVAVGMKIICFCHWIVKNLPKTDNEIQCCKKCCESKKDEEYSLKHKKNTYDIDDEYIIQNKS